ncbi:MAG TPA: sulfatase-like hydrolase/transferase [Pirellulales bacterium]|nr:sulfatase-like hydrolase/transferase [Pirellulales bacterium]
MSKTMKMSMLAWLGTLVLTAAFCRHADAADVPSRPNVVLMMADDLGWGETGYNGHPQLKTPTLDSMAATALRLDRFYAAAPVCSPTRASVLTGRHPNRSGVFAPNYSTRPEEITLAQILKSAGYRTGHFGKWHVGAVKAASPTNPARMGFDEYLSHDNFFEMDPMLSHNGAEPEQHRGESSEIIVDAALEFIGKVQAEQKPFFVVVWFGSPHGPYSGLKKDLDLYPDAPNDEMRARFAEITAMDRAIGEFRDALRKRDVANNTLLWFNSDNGIPVGNEKLSFNGGWRGKKGDVYEGGLLVPAVIEWPDVIREPRQSSVHCVTSDIFPTVLDFLGLHSPDPKRPIDGISLRNLIASDTMRERPSPIGFWKYPIAGEKKNPRYMDEELTRGTTPTSKNPAIDFTNYRHPVARTSDFGGEAAWTDNRYKLVVSENAKREKTALFDLIDDPKEEHDIADEHPKVVKAMTSQLHEWQRSVERSLSGEDY